MSKLKIADKDNAPRKKLQTYEAARNYAKPKNLVRIEGNFKAPQSGNTMNLYAQIAET